LKRKLTQSRRGKKRKNYGDLLFLLCGLCGLCGSA
jgi:hypothetical protein